MKIVLWNTKRSNQRNPFASRERNGVLNRLISSRRLTPDHHQRIDSTFAFLAAAARMNGQEVEYCEDIAPEADLYVMVPTAETLAVEYNMIQSLNQARPGLRIWVVGPLATQLESLFLKLDVQVIKGDPRGLAMSWSELINHPERSVDVRLKRPLNSQFEYPAWDVIRSRLATANAETFRASTCQIPLFENDSVEFLIDQMDRSNQVYGFRNFRLVDACHQQREQWIEHFVTELSRRKPRIRFACSLDDSISRHQLLHLRKQGMQTVEVQIQDTPQVEFHNQCRAEGLKTEAVFCSDVDQVSTHAADLLQLAKRVNANRSKYRVDAVPIERIIRGATANLEVAVEFVFDPRRCARNIKQISEWSHESKQSIQPKSRPVLRAA